MLPVLLSLAFLVSGSVQAAPVASAALGSVFEAPRPWFDREVRVTFQLKALPEDWDPVLTRFGTRDYVAAEVWGDGQFLWRVRDFERPLGLLFARRESPAADRLATAAPFERFTARIHVRQVFLGRPWAEIVELTPELRAVGEGSILHASRALQLMASEDWLMARDDLLRAAAPLLPRHARNELERLIAVCNERIAQRELPKVPAR